MKTKKLLTLEKYSVVAVRAKLSVEVEQRKRLGTWAKRVLVLDGATLYAYKTKGDGGSVGGWAVGGADVHIGRGSDSSRDDGRHILVIARPPAYKLTFSFNTTYEQARMIQALSSSGATVTGLDAIMLLKNLRKHQEEEHEEEEERKRELKEQKMVLEENRDLSDTRTSLGSDERKEVSESDDEDLTLSKNKTEDDELEEINESIYDLNTGVVSNPLYSSNVNLSVSEGDDVAVKDSTNLTYSNSSGPSGASNSSASSSNVLVANQNSDGKVNPLPKPPRAGPADRRPSTESQTQSEFDEAEEHQSSFSGDKEEELPGEERESKKSIEVVDGPCLDAFGEEISDEEKVLVETRNRVYCENSEEGEGFDQVTSDSDENVDSESKVNAKRTDCEENSESLSLPKRDRSPDETVNKEEEEEEERVQEPFEDNYTHLLSKMKLERGLSLATHTGDVSQDIDSHETYLKNAHSPHLDSPSSDSPTPFEEPENGSDKEESVVGNNDKETKYDEIQEQDDKGKDNPGQKSASDETLSDSDDKFELLYNEMNNNSQEELQTEPPMSEENEKNTKREESQDTPLVSPENIIKENGHVEEENDVDFPSDETTPVKRVNSIIKKKDRGSVNSGSGSVKKVQFNLDVDTIEPPSLDLSTTESPVTDTGEGSPTSTTRKKPDSSSNKKRKEGLLKAVGVHKSKKESTGTTTPGKTDKKLTETTTPGSPSKKKSTDSSTVTSSTKKKTTDFSNSSSPTKKKGIFSSIFSGTSSKKSDSQLPAKDDANSKRKASDTSPTALKRQPTVDLTAPLIINGQVEISGSIGGKVSARRVEVRDGHVLAFLPHASTPSSKISLMALSVTPVLGGVHQHALSLNRATRVMMVIKLTSREEMMRWIHTLSDEVIKVTQEDQRNNLTLYPSPHRESEKEEEEPKQEEEREEGTNSQKEESKKEKEEEVVDNDYSEGAAMEEKSVTKVQEATNITPALDTTVKKDNDLVDSLHSFSSDQNLNGITDKQKEEERDTNKEKTVEREGKRKKESEIQKKIQQFSQGERRKDDAEAKYKQQKMETRTQRKTDEGKKSHPPLRRLSGQGKFSPQPSDAGTDTTDNFLMVNKLPGYPSNRQNYPKKLNESSRIMSSSESSLRTSVECQGGVAAAAAAAHGMQRYGSEIIPQTGSWDQANPSGNRITRDKILTRGSGSQTSLIVSVSQPMNESRASPSPTLSPRLHHLTQPRAIEIIEKTNKMARPTSLSGIKKQRLTPDKERWYEDDSSDNETPATPVKDDAEEVPSVTWSVAATREKFELLCSVSGENKGGRLTTKTPISRKRSSRGTVKKKRSLEGAMSRRSTVRRGGRKSLLPSDDLNSSQELQGDESDLKTEPQSQRESLRLPPVRDLRKNFETDRTDSPFCFHTSSVESTEEPSSPIKSPFRKTSNILQEPYTPESSPEPRILTSRLMNSRPSGISSVAERMTLTQSFSTDSSHPSSSLSSGDVVICWRGPYIAQEAEQSVLANISNAFLAKRRLLSREVAAARIQERLSLLEERAWNLQASMAQIDNSSVRSIKETREWKALEKSLRAVEEETSYYNARLMQTQKEADIARQKLAAALTSGFSQQTGSTTPEHHPLDTSHDEGLYSSEA
ncbi:microtubule-associated protein futsch-like isoform X2 [Homarus americanus]|uniref:microtubule-associated protein futsch-like isoform X2 n=1 Tax=Homarus americanus TaxID=6706 RepID=UPI001C44D28D|nr:microtubule-associated protein futsch-like isoform X2 [Homarus americanus]